MAKSYSQIIDELIIVNIKIVHLRAKKKLTLAEQKKLKDLNRSRLELGKALDGSKVIKKSFSQIVDELTIANIKIFMLVDKIQKNKHSKEDAKKLQDLNSYRAKLCNDLNKEFKQRMIIKI